MPSLKMFNSENTQTQPRSESTGQICQTGTQTTEVSSVKVSGAVNPSRPSFKRPLVSRNKFLTLKPVEPISTEHNSGYGVTNFLYNCVAYPVTAVTTVVTLPVSAVSYMVYGSNKEPLPEISFRMRS